jgi:hypothetical protein
MDPERKTLGQRAYEFIWERDPFGDHFSQHDLETIRDATIPNSPDRTDGTPKGSLS